MVAGLGDKEDNSSKAETLTRLRDVLLSNSISGELSAPDAERIVREVHVVSAETLTSLAILKVNVDHGGDYLEYLRPFILQILFGKKPDPVTDANVCNYLQTQFGLAIPERTVQIVLQRISRSGLLKRESG